MTATGVDWRDQRGDGQRHRCDAGKQSLLVVAKRFGERAVQEIVGRRREVTRRVRAVAGGFDEGPLADLLTQPANMVG